MDQRRGRIEPGMDADFTVFSEDIFTIADPDALLQVRCDLAIVGGTVSHDRHGEAFGLASSA